MLKGSGGSVAGFLQFDLVPGLFQPGSDLVPALLRKKGSGGSVAGILQFQPGSGPGSARFRPGSIAPSSTFYNGSCLVPPGSDLVPSLQTFCFTTVPAWFRLAPPGFQTVRLFRTSIFLRGRRRGNPGRRLLRNLGRVCWTSATTSTRTLMWRASAKVCPAASKTWGATPKALPCFFWECKLLLHMTYPGLPWRGAVGVWGGRGKF